MWDVLETTLHRILLILYTTSGQKSHSVYEFVSKVNLVTGASEDIEDKSHGYRQNESRTLNPRREKVSQAAVVKSNIVSPPVFTSTNWYSPCLHMGWVPVDSIRPHLSSLIGLRDS